MKILGSYHNHTRYSKFRHGKNTVKEMCNAARMSGIQEFAITDHASGHLFGVQKRKISKLREEIDKCKKENEEMNLLMGLEFNLLGLDGRIDFDEDTAKLLDIRLLGFHKLGRCGLKNFFKFVLPNLFCSYFYYPIKVDILSILHIFNLAEDFFKFSCSKFFSMLF